MNLEPQFIEQINANPDDRATQLIYADWLDQQGDPRAEAWRVLIEQGKRPTKDFRPPGGRPFEGWNWFPNYPLSFPAHSILPFYKDIDFEIRNGQGEDFFSAMDAAAIAWVRCHRDPEFMRETEEAKGEFK